MVDTQVTDRHDVIVAHNALVQNQLILLLIGQLINN